MMNGKKVFRLTISGLLLVAIVATCVGLYQAETKKGTEEKKLAQGIQSQEDNSATNEQETQKEEEPSADVGTNSVEGLKQIEEAPQPAPEAAPETEAAPEEAVSSDVVEEQAETPVEPSVDFTEESLMEWPINGEILLDYSMDKTVYYPTLDVYKYSPAIVIGTEVNTPVMAVANSQVVSIVSNEETGTTVTMDMGNGYQAVYGQLKEVALEEGAVVEGGTVLGYVSEPTKYYSSEGSNLYFALTKDGSPLDPMMYLP